MDKYTVKTVVAESQLFVNMLRNVDVLLDVLRDFRKFKAVRYSDAARQELLDLKAVIKDLQAKSEYACDVYDYDKVSDVLLTLVYALQDDAANRALCDYVVAHALRQLACDAVVQLDKDIEFEDRNRQLDARLEYEAEERRHFALYE